MEANDVKYMTNGALLKERDRYKIRMSGASRAAKYDKSLRVPLEQARSEAAIIDAEIRRRGIDDFLEQLPLL